MALLFLVILYLFTNGPVKCFNSGENVPFSGTVRAKGNVRIVGHFDQNGRDSTVVSSSPVPLSVNAMPSVYTPISAPIVPLNFDPSLTLSPSNIPSSSSINDVSSVFPVNLPSPSSLLPNSPTLSPNLPSYKESLVYPSITVLPKVYSPSVRIPLANLIPLSVLVKKSDYSKDSLVKSFYNVDNDIYLNDNPTVIIPLEHNNPHYRIKKNLKSSNPNNILITEPTISYPIDKTFLDSGTVPSTYINLNTNEFSVINEPIYRQLEEINNVILKDTWASINPYFYQEVSSIPFPVPYRSYSLNDFRNTEFKAPYEQVKANGRVTISASLGPGDNSYNFQQPQFPSMFDNFQNFSPVGNVNRLPKSDFYFDNVDNYGYFNFRKQPSYNHQLIAKGKVTIAAHF